MANLGPYILCVCILISVLLPLLAVYAKRLASQERQWPKYPGRITISEVVRVRDRCHSAQVRYSYRCNGAQYNGDNIRSYSWSGSSDRRQAEQVCARYPVGAGVDVFVDPTDSARSVLEPGGNRLLIPTALAASVFFIGLGFQLAK